ncbi:two component transcriptional regulator, LuxR family [Aquimarina amphilecti]|uniref:Two component transcriptional regulator, LuxR family n=1 Tax=Aquimarina amphilecti TaxID=1038014 RepID=A0A1H7X873_AQUAM|nr:response regulator transcription factor [Aquimarina amphilecti]SEM29855.1 two component transcriptional regulator, LuxR family [Aquimarina amphilecti]
MTKNNTYKLVVADDHKMFLDGLLSIISHESDYEIVYTANNGFDLKKYLEINSSDQIDLAILDINMPKMDGVALNHYIKENHPTIKTLIVSMLSEPQKIYELTQAAVNGYIPKNAKKEELLKAIETILKGSNYFSNSIKEAYTKSIFEQKQNNEINLSKREKEILQLIAKEYTTQEIADQLFLSKYTIEGYRTSLISKLNVKNVVGLAKHAIKLGLVD